MRFFEAVSTAQSLSWSLSCPIHCGSSIVPWFISGVSVGFLLAVITLTLSLWHLNLCPSETRILIHLSRLAPLGSVLHRPLALQLAWRAVCMDQTLTELTQAVQVLSVRHQCAKIDSDGILRILEPSYRSLRPMKNSGLFRVSFSGPDSNSFWLHWVFRLQQRNPWNYLH